MNILITGGCGQLTGDLRQVFAGDDVYAPGREDLDICSPEQIEAALDRIQPDILLNTAAFHSVDLCEMELEKSFLVNAAAPQRLAAACARRDIRLVHYSTDYVFDGTAHEPYSEDHQVAPINIYGVSKAAGEMAIRAASGDHLIVRTTGLYGSAGAATGRGNFVETMIRLGSTQEVTPVVCDQVLTPTSTADLAALTRTLLERGARGTVHVTNSGQCSWYDFAAAIFHRANLPGRVEPIPQRDRPTPARRPAYSVLAYDALRRLDIPEPRPWQEALAEYLSGRGQWAMGNGLSERSPKLSAQGS